MLLAAPARAHDFRPGALVVDLRADGQLSVRVQLPPEHAGAAITLALPASCRLTRPLPALCAACDPAAPGALELRNIPADLELVAHLRAPGQPPRATILRAASPTLPLHDTKHDPFTRYLGLGVEHILGGPDHLLFVAGLTLWVRGPLVVLSTLTAFTAAHSITLALASLDVVHLPGPPVEACIALSIVLLARAILRPNLSPGTPWRFALACGLLHGFGFAGALADIGLPEDAMLPALAAFNLGVELGQVALALVVVAFAALLDRLLPRLPLRRLLAYLIGAVASAWTLERALALGTST